MLYIDKEFRQTHYPIISKEIPSEMDVFLYFQYVYLKGHPINRYSQLKDISYNAAIKMKTGILKKLIRDLNVSFMGEPQIKNSDSPLYFVNIEIYKKIYSYIPYIKLGIFSYDFLISIFSYSHKVAIYTSRTNTSKLLRDSQKLHIIYRSFSLIIDVLIFIYQP
jgi:hypothetical protein